MNFAEKVASELNRRGRSVLPPIYVESGDKIDGLNTDQITTHKEEYLSSFVSRLLEKIPEQASLQFVSLILPSKAVDKAEYQLAGNVLLRYIEMKDGDMQRWDALIRLPNNYTVVNDHALNAALNKE